MKKCKQALNVLLKLGKDCVLGGDFSALIFVARGLYSNVYYSASKRFLPRRATDEISLIRKAGGETGIRTLETVASLHAFQACAFDHSATSPYKGRQITLSTPDRKAWIAVWAICPHI